jgi:hypothetical protein
MCVQAQENYWIKTDSLFKYVQPVASLQFWSTYTMGEKDQLTDNGPMESVQDRLNFLIRRARIGFKGKPYKKLSYAVMIRCADQPTPVRWVYWMRMLHGASARMKWLR